MTDEKLKKATDLKEKIAALEQARASVTVTKSFDLSEDTSHRTLLTIKLSMSFKEANGNHSKFISENSSNVGVGEAARLIQQLIFIYDAEIAKAKAEYNQL